MSKRNIVIVLAAITALIHLYVGISVPAPLLLLNGIGFLVLIAARYFIPQLIQYRQAIHYALIAYTAITIIGYFAAWGVEGFSDVTGMIAKVVEVALIAVLALDRD